jgi:alpha-tubulin suppressor-like RCC1 family protein
MLLKRVASSLASFHTNRGAGICLRLAFGLPLPAVLFFAACARDPVAPTLQGRLALAGTGFILAPGEYSVLGFAVRDGDQLRFGGSLPREPAFSGTSTITVGNSSIATVDGASLLRAVAIGSTNLTLRVNRDADSATLHVIGDAASGASATRVTVGGQHACLESSSGIRCWGSSWFGELGDGSARPLTATLAPVSVRNAAGLRAVSAGTTHSCALSSDGRAFCWGHNLVNQVRPGLAAVQSTPVVVSDTLRFLSVVAGGDHSCGKTVQLDFACWGRGYTGIQKINPSGRIADVSAGDGHTCALDEAGDAWCRGEGSYGQLGNGAFGSSTAFVRVAGNLRFSQLSAGALHTCALTLGQTVACWGRGMLGALGTGLTVDVAVPVEIALPRPATSVDAGTLHSCVILVGGEAWCWGRNHRGELGLGAPDTPASGDAFVALAPRPVNTPLRFSSISAGADETTCAVTIDEAVYCWGNNLNGTVGSGRFEIDATTGSPVYWKPVRVRQHPNP